MAGSYEMKFFNKKKCDNCGSHSHLRPIQTRSDGVFRDEGLFLCEPCIADLGDTDLDYLYRALTPERPALKQFDNNHYKESLK